jgi:hypothetical protein
VCAGVCVRATLRSCRRGRINEFRSHANQFFLRVRARVVLLTERSGRDDARGIKFINAFAFRADVFSELCAFRQTIVI